MKNKIILMTGLLSMLLGAGCKDDDNAMTPTATPPVITDISPEEGKSGIEVSINGSNFGLNPEENNVTFNGSEATVIDASPTLLLVEVPVEAGTGPVEITVDEQTATGPTFTWYPNNTRFVDTNGSDDSNDCYDVGMPCATVAYALEQAEPGDVIDIAPGVYTETLLIDKPITLQGAGGMDAGGTVLRGHEQPGRATDRVITIKEGHVVSISDLQVGNGYAPGNLHPAASGGGIYVEGSLLDLTNVTIAFNKAGRSGGGIYMQNALCTFTNVVFNGNEAMGLVGGGLRNWISSPKLVNVEFIQNKAGTRGGGMNNENGSSPVLTDVTFNGNEAGVSGGGMYNYRDSHPRLTNVTFESNKAVVNGGGMVNTSGGSSILSNVTFRSNSAGLNGGGLWNDAPASMSPELLTTLTGVELTGNTAGSFGGGIFNYGGSVELLGVVLTENVANNQGGGLYNYIGAIARLQNVVFSNNEAESGGGMANIASEALLVNATFDGNDAGISGGGMLNYQSSPGLVNVTFSGNHSGANGGAMDNTFSSLPILLNTILWGNTAVSNGNQIHNTTSSSVKLDFCLYSNETSDIKEGGGVEAENSLTEDPNFVDAANGDLRLGEGSHAIDSGGPNTDTDAFPADENDEPIDLDGNPRVFNSTIDIGAYEYQGE